MTIHHHMKAIQASGSDFALPNTPRSYAPDLKLEPTHIDLTVDVDIDEASATVDVTTTMISRAPDAQQIVLDGIDLNNVSVQDVDGHTIGWDYEGDKITITYANPISVGEQRSVRVCYDVHRPITGMTFSSLNNHGPNHKHRYMVTDHETERARYWLACVDHPACRTTLDIRLRAPSDMEILATGKLLGTTAHDDGTTTAHWRCQQPCPSYLICLVVGDFVRCEDGEFDGKPIAYFGLPPFTKDDLQRSFGPTKQMLSFLTQKLGSPLPWAKYYQFAAPGVGGAMENISMVSWDDMFVFDERLYEEWGHVLDSINLHEMAHTWFGDLLVCRDFSHVWLKESWATYMESVWLEDSQGDDELHYNLYESRTSYFNESDNAYARPIVTRTFDSAWSMYDNHLYPGGAIRLHLLRTELGDEAFWAAVKDYVAAHSAQVVETHDFRLAMERRSGRYLERFFDQWFRSPGYPKLKASMEHDDGFTTLRLSQTQKDDKKKIGLFTFDLDIAVEDAKGEWTTHTINISCEHHTLRFASAEKPQQIIIDPQMKVPHSLEFDPGKTMGERALSHSPWVIGRIHAAKTLAKSGRRPSIIAIGEAYKKEAHWGVRIQMTSALGTAGTADAIGVLKSILSFETDPRVMAPLIDACAKYRDTGLSDNVHNWIEVENRPYRAHGRALRMLGAQRGEKWIPLLKSGLKDHSWGGWVRMGAVLGLAQTHSKEALESVLAVCADHSEVRIVRRAAIACLPDLAKTLDKATRQRVCEALSDLTLDPKHNVRLWAVQALASLGESAGIAAIGRTHGTIAKQEHPAIERAIKRLQGKGPGSEVKKLNARVDKLTDSQRKLEQRIRDLESHHPTKDT